MELAKREALDLTYAIYLDYDNDAVIRPYALISKHPTEEEFSGSMYDRHLYKFCEYKVHETCGVSWAEYLSMDMASAIMTLNMAKRYIEMQRKHFDQTQNSLEEERKSLLNSTKEKK